MRRLIPAVFSLIALISWSAAGQTIPRRDGAAPPSRQGTAVVRGLPLRRVRITLAGGTLAMLAEGQWEDAEFLAAALDGATAVTVTEGARQRVSLRLADRP